MDSIHLLSNKIKSIKQLIDRQFLVTITILTIVSICSFIGGFWVGKGSHEKITKDPVVVYGSTVYPSSDVTSVREDVQSQSKTYQTNTATASYFGSKRGKKYYPIHCLSASKLKPENRVYFDSAEQAEAKGLTVSDGC